MKYPVKYGCSTFLKWLYGWGEKPWRIFVWCGVTIFIFSGLYCLIGDITLAMDATIVKSYPAKLYFSGITFTTLGFGGYSPMGGAKALAFIESFLGIFSIALFVYSFARRTAGRWGTARKKAKNSDGPELQNQVYTGSSKTVRESEESMEQNDEIHKNQGEDRVCPIAIPWSSKRQVGN